MNAQTCAVVSAVSAGRSPRTKKDVARLEDFDDLLQLGVATFQRADPRGSLATEAVALAVFDLLLADQFRNVSAFIPSRLDTA